MKTNEDVLAKVTELYSKAVDANELDLAARMLELAANILRQ